MYRRIYYDGTRIHLWETTLEGKRETSVHNDDIEYYIPDNTGTSPITDIFGNPVMRQTSKSRSIVTDLASSMNCCETDIPEVTKFLQKRYANVELKPDINIFKIGIIDIECESGSEFPYPEQAKYPINLITVRNLKTLKTYTFGNRPYTGNSKTVDEYHYFPDEREMLSTFVQFFRRCSFDIITGWNVLNFDMRYIVHRLRVLGIDKTISPIGQIYEDEKGNMTIGGLNVLDYQAMYKEFLKIPMSSYSLNFVCMRELGEGKLELEGAINTAYKTDWNRFVEYNINDVDLVQRLDNKHKLILLCVTLAYQALIPFEKTLSTIPLVEGLLLKALHKNNMVMNDRSGGQREEYSGGYVEAEPGFYFDVLSFDVESMYPHLMMMFNISPETLVLNPQSTEGLISSPAKGIYFRKDKEGFIPKVVKHIFQERKEFKNRMKILTLKNKGLSSLDIAKRLHMDFSYVDKELEIIAQEKETVEYYDLQQYVRKIFANSVYGTLGNPYFHFFNINNAKAVTIGGQTLIKHLSNQIKEGLKKKFGIKENPVVIIDTDSCYIQFKTIIDKLKISFLSDKERIDYYLKFIGDVLTPIIDKSLKIYSTAYNVEQMINFKHEKIMTKLAVIVKKHYIMEIIYSEGDIYDPPKIKPVGVQTVRSDTPEFCRGKLKEVIDLVFKTLDREKVVDLVKQDKQEFRTQPGNIIASTKGLNKYEEYAVPLDDDIATEYASDFDDYKADGTNYPLHCPIHIKAAIAYNYMIKQDKLALLPANRGAKIKYIYVNEDNPAQTNAIGFIGRWPKEFDKYFTIDYDLQFEKTFMPIIDDLFGILKWDEINYEESILDELFTD